jgi:hypothetical protein
MKKLFTSKLSNAVEPAASTDRTWGYRGCAGKGGKTKNSNIVNKSTEKETN